MRWALSRVCVAFAILAIFALGINFYVRISANGRIIRDVNYAQIPQADCIIVLGAGIWGDRPSPMLEDRLLRGIELYQSGVSDKILMSGDHGQVDYDEVNLMKSYAMEHGVPSEDIFMDHAGFSTYESMYRARDIFQAHSVVVVTQDYHLYRAVYIARQLGLEAYGVGADTRSYAGALFREIREILARNKDFFKCILKPEPTYLGDPIPISGDGNATND